MALQKAPNQNGVTPEDIWNALIGIGATPVQAAGIMGNMQAESGFNPDVKPGDNGTSFGLFQQHGSYSYLSTGSPATDMIAQIRTMIANGGMASATGSTPAEVASNFAHGYERCAACGYQDGTSELDARAANATAIYQAATTGKWETIGYSANAAGAPSPAGAGSNATGTGCHARVGNDGSNCAINFPGSFCITYCELKGIAGGAIMVGGVLLALVGVLILSKGAIGRTVRRLPAGALVGAGAATLSQRSGAGLGARRRAPGRAQRDRERQQNIDVQTRGGEAYDSGYQRAMMDMEARLRETETPFE